MTQTSSLLTSTAPQHDIIDEYALDRIRFRIRQLDSQFELSDEDREDLHNDMVRELLNAFRRFNPLLAQRQTFISRVLDRFVLYAMRQYCMKQERDFENPVGFEQIHVGYEPRINNPSQGELDERDRSDLRMDVIQIVSELPEDLQRVCRVLMEQSGRSAARELGMSKSTLYRAIAQIREHFVERGYADFFQNSWDTFGSTADIDSAGNESEESQ
ncbi:MAG TPA: hypothetical protein DCM28_03240 [Phycisphaerales bacterium]|nr:hypothetical protein [Phycisphaerales bacterium]HCD31154.1 hypothetical protein [Phycisphaerales bacterium]|tara:strand:- start:850 stop:1494 length:645 start_codon:yes stop_codon:yes gene_type:complete